VVAPIEPGARVDERQDDDDREDDGEEVVRFDHRDDGVEGDDVPGGVPGPALALAEAGHGDDEHCQRRDDHEGAPGVAVDVKQPVGAVVISNVL